MKNLVILGAGKIGRMVCHMLATSGDYSVRIGDSSQAAVDVVSGRYEHATGTVVDFGDAASLDSVLNGAFGVISCAPFHCNPLIAERALANGVHYFDLTEDVAVTKRVMELADGSKTAFAPQCGLAPGFITIVATHLVSRLTEVQDLCLRVGALPRFSSNRLKYNLTWSTQGLINEYCQPCEVILDGKLTTVQPLENLERLTIDGVEYEAFNTSGGLGTLAASLDGKVRNLNYKTIRFPGHCELLKLLLQDLRMKDHQDELASIFERALPGTFQDQIVIFVSATGQFRGKFTQRTYAKTILHSEIDGENWSGIQITTAAGVCGVVDLLAAGKLPQQGLVRMEQVPYAEFVKNRFGSYYA
ncbi:MAG: saccharopine dehydrogenase family protein [Planctomycetota bacterium]